MGSYSQRPRRTCSQIHLKQQQVQSVSKSYTKNPRRCPVDPHWLVGLLAFL